MVDEAELEELAKLIAKVRYPKAPNAFVTAEEIALAIQKAGFFKVENQILVTGKMRDAALLSYYRGCSAINEVSEPYAAQRMTDALYSAISVWKENKALTSKDHAQRKLDVAD